MNANLFATSSDTENRFVEVVVPLNLPQTLTYGIPLEWQGSVLPGMRVEVVLGRNKLYAGLVVAVHNNQPTTYQVKPICYRQYSRYKRITISVLVMDMPILYCQSG